MFGPDAEKDSDDVHAGPLKNDYSWQPRGEIKNVAGQDHFTEESADLLTWNRGAWIGLGKRAVFAANIGTICKKTNAVDLSSQVITNRDE